MKEDYEMRLKDKVAIITGAGSGIGRATAVLFAKEGAKVVVVDIDKKAGEETVRIIRSNGGEAIFVQADVSKATDAERIVKTTIEEYGKVDILFNNAGVWVRGIDTVVDAPEEEWDRVININLKSVFLCSKYAIPEMIKNGGGVIINMASAQGLVGTAGYATYCASKGGVVLLTKATALDYAPYNIRVNCLCPGAVATPPLYKKGWPNDPKLKQIIKELEPIGRPAEPEEIAYAALFLASDESSFMTGAALVVDGGWTAR